jgi:hypothetical protein
LEGGKIPQGIYLSLLLRGFRSRWIAKSNGAVAVDLAIHSEQSQNLSDSVATQITRHGKKQTLVGQ